MAAKGAMAALLVPLLVAALLACVSPPGAAAVAAEQGVLRMKPCDGGYPYNRTLAHILVEYASANNLPLDFKRPLPFCLLSRL
ncbi:hypothetical protein SEVIR_8G230275v4 [Setaria viridis]|uniref:Uncharacterized protein n=1 Tax=Setaria viridis TaxID=4556 RepID=A0A4U6TNR8_SETVI|nr:hypothetical protein SEVIR_8G230275v2 [Setaria viridis]